MQCISSTRLPFCSILLLISFVPFNPTQITLPIVIVFLKMLFYCRASQSSKVPDIPKPIITQALHTTDLKTNDSNTAVNSSEIRSDQPIDDLSSLTIQDNMISNATTMTNSGGYDLTGQHNSFAVHQSVNEDTSIIHGNNAINSTGDVTFNRQGSGDSDCSRNHQPAKDNVPSHPPHKGQQSKPGNNKAPKKSKDKKNTANDKSKQNSGHRSGGTSPVKHDNVPKTDKENTVKVNIASNTGGDGHKKKKKDTVVAPTEIAVPQVTAVSKSENVLERKAPPTGVKAPPPGLTKQPSHTNAVNGMFVC